MTETITREVLLALADREGIELEKADTAIELAILVGNALSRLPVRQRDHAKQLTLAAMLDRSPERIQAMLSAVFRQEVRHEPRS